MPLTDEQVQKMLAHAQERTVRGTGNEGVAKVFLTNDCEADFRPLLDSTGAPFLEKKRHQFVGDGVNLEVECAKNCQICDTLAALPRWSNRWRFLSRPFSIAYAVILWVIGVKKDFLRVNEPVLLVHNSLDYVVSAVMTELATAERVRTYFNPEIPQYPVNLTIRKRPGHKRAELSVGFDRNHDRVTIPGLPSGFPPLTEALHLKNDPIRVHEFIEALRSDYNLSMNIKDIPRNRAVKKTESPVIPAEPVVNTGAEDGNGQFQPGLPAASAPVPDLVEGPVSSPAPSDVLHIDVDAAIPPPESCQGWGRHGHIAQCDQCEWSVECERERCGVATSPSSTQATAVEEAGADVSVPIPPCPFTFGHPRSVPQCITCVRGDACWAKASCK